MLSPLGPVKRWCQQLRQLGDIRRDASGFVSGEQMRRRSSAGFVIEIDVGQRLPIGAGLIRTERGLKGENDVKGHELP